MDILLPLDKMTNLDNIAVMEKLWDDLCQDPESKLMESGKLLVTFTLASNTNYRDRNGDWQQDATFIQVSAWDKLAEYSAERLHKGSAVFLTGRLNSRDIKARNGNRSVLGVIARQIQFLDKVNGLEQDSRSEIQPPNGQAEKSDDLPF